MTTNPVGDVTMSYVDLLPEAPGEAVPVLLLHGFGSDFQMNWGSTGWVRDLEAAGRRVIGPDLRGHGASDKPTESAFYLPEHFVSDLVDLLDRLGLERVDVVGYSMGARLAWELALTAPGRVRRLVLGGFGPDNALAGVEEGVPGEGDTPFDQVYRTVVGLPGNDADALAACALGQAARPFTPEPRPEGVPILFAAGAKDPVAAGVEGLAEAIGATFVEVPKRDHVNAVSSRAFRRAVIDFLEVDADEA